MAGKLMRSASASAADAERPLIARRRNVQNISIPIRGSFRHRAHMGWEPEHGYVAVTDTADPEMDRLLSDAFDIIKGGMQCLENAQTVPSEELPAIVVTTEKSKSSNRHVMDVDSGSYSVQNGSFTLPTNYQKNGIGLQAPSQKRLSDFSFLKRFSLNRSGSAGSSSSSGATTPTKKSKNLLRSLSDASLFLRRSAVGKRSREPSGEQQMEISSPIPGTFKHVQHVGFGDTRLDPTKS